MPNYRTMSQVSRPLLGALLAAVVLLAVWMVALKPSSNGTTSSKPTVTAPGVAGLARAVDKAHKAVASSNAASAAHGGTIVTTPTTGTIAATSPTVTTPTTTTAHSTAANQSATSAAAPKSLPSAAALNVVSRALAAKKVLALLFYNPAGSDDRAVQQELASIRVYGGHVLEMAIPLKDLSRYPVVTTQVPVTASPTLVVVDAHQRATTIEGFADSFEIAQRITDALQAR
jgi:hypothetical protein